VFGERMSCAKTGGPILMIYVSHDVDVPFWVVVNNDANLGGQIS